MYRYSYTYSKRSLVQKISLLRAFEFNLPVDDCRLTVESLRQINILNHQRTLARLTEVYIKYIRGH